MQIQKIQNNNRYNPNFRMAINYRPSEIRVKSYILRNYANKERLLLQSFLDKLSQNPVNITLSLESDNFFKDFLKLRAFQEDGTLISEETPFNKVYSVLEHALKLSTHETELKEQAEANKKFLNSRLIK